MALRQLLLQSQERGARSKGKDGRSGGKGKAPRAHWAGVSVEAARGSFTSEADATSATFPFSMIEVGTLEDDQQCTEWCVVKHTLDSLACCAWLPTSPREVGTSSPRTVWRNEVPSMVHEIKHTPIPTSLGTQNADVKSMSGRGFGARFGP